MDLWTHRPIPLIATPLVLCAAFCLLFPNAVPAQALAAATLPDAPSPNLPVSISDVQQPQAQEPGEQQAAQSQQIRQGPAGQATRPGFPPVSPQVRKQPSGSKLQHPEIPSMPGECIQDMSAAHPVLMSCAAGVDPYARFLNSVDVHPLTGRQKARLAWRNTTDPFNFLTIGFLSGLAVASDSHSDYGPGWPGFGKNVGVAVTETAVGEFFGTFLIPTIAHQDPHYHREPNASISHRTLHAIASVVWAQSDTGQGMPNYSVLGTTAIGIALGDLYVPGARQGFGPGVERYVTAIASDPINTLVTEFLPDFARHVNVRIVLVQRIVDQVERQNNGS